MEQEQEVQVQVQEPGQEAPEQPEKPRKEKKEKAPKKEREPKKEKEPKRRSRPIDAKETFVPEEDPCQMHGVFRKRLTYLMNGNNPREKAVNIQELADAVGVSRPAIRKYLKPKDHGQPTTPSALTVCRIAQFFGVTPNFLLGFDEPSAPSQQLAWESEYYNRLGLNEATLESLRKLRGLRAVPACAEQAAGMLSMLDKQIAAFAQEALRLLEKEAQPEPENTPAGR